MLEALGEWMGFPMYYSIDGAAPPPRSGASHATIYPYGTFATGDGKSVLLGVQNEREWLKFCAEVLERPAIATDPRFTSNTLRTAHRAALEAVAGAVALREHDLAVLDDGDGEAGHLPVGAGLRDVGIEGAEVGSALGGERGGGGNDERRGREQAQAEIGQVVEGVLAARAVHDVARRVDVEMPISEQIYRVLYEGAPAKQAVYALMGRTVKAETE